MSRHEDWQGKGSALDAADHERDVALILEAGANAVRLAHYPHPDHVLELCDRAGLLAWVEVPFVDSFMGGYADTPAFRENGQQQLREMIRQGMNHPSVFLWGLYNELTERGGRGPAQLAYVRELQALAQEEDPRRPTTAASLLGPTHPLVGPRHDRFQPLLRLVQRATRRPWALPGRGGPRAPGQGDRGQRVRGGRGPLPPRDPTAPAVPDLPPLAPGGAPVDRPRGQLGRDRGAAVRVGQLRLEHVDFGVHSRREGATNARNDKGLVTWDRAVRKDAFFFYEAAWSAEPVLHVAGRRHVVRDWRART